MVVEEFNADNKQVNLLGGNIGGRVQYRHEFGRINHFSIEIFISGIFNVSSPLRDIEQFF